MAKRLKIDYPVADGTLSTYRIVGSGAAATIDRGTPCKEGSAGAVAIMVDGDGTTSQRFSGLAKSVSTDTASAAGSVQLILPLPGLIYSGLPLTAGAADTQAEIDALNGKRVVWDLTSGDWTVDSAASDSATNGVVIVGGRKEEDTLQFVVSVSCSFLE